MSDKYFDSSMPVNVTERNLPHWTQEGKIYFVTFRLADSLPQAELNRLKIDREQWLKDNPNPLGESQKREYHKLFSQKADKWLDAGYGDCILRNPGVCKVVENAVRFFDGRRLSLHSYVVMPNHVHLLLQLYDEIKLSDILHSIKSFSAKQINRLLSRQGHVWGAESYDRIIRDARHYENVKKYIVKNVMSGGLLWKI